MCACVHVVVVMEYVYVGLRVHVVVFMLIVCVCVLRVQHACPCGEDIGVGTIRYDSLANFGGLAAKGNDSWR